MASGQLYNGSILCSFLSENNLLFRGTVTKVTTNNQKLPITGKNSILSLFFASAKGQSPPQELEVGLRSGPILLVYYNT